MKLSIFIFSIFSFFLTAFYPLFAKRILIPEKALQSAIAQTLGIPEHGTYRRSC